MNADYDDFLLKLEAEQLSWWEYSRKVPIPYRPKEYINYWSFLKNKKRLPKRFIKEAEWRREGRRKGFVDIE
jgi:hypothetical protein